MSELNDRNVRTLPFGWIYLMQNGQMAYGRQRIYLGSSGAMLTNARTPDGYYVGADGAWIPGK